MNKIAVALTVLALSGCATTYRPSEADITDTNPKCVIPEPPDNLVLVAQDNASKVVTLVGYATVLMDVVRGCQVLLNGR